MSTYDQLLVITGVATVVICALLIAIPYFLGRRDLLLPSTFYLAGMALFIGISAISSGTVGHYVQYPDAVYQMFFLGFFVFYTILFVTYRYWKLPRRLAGRVFLRMPRVTTMAMLSMSFIAAILCAMAFSPPPIPVVSQLAFHLGVRAGPFALVFALTAIYRDRSNPICWTYFLLLSVLAIGFSISFGSGRRIALSVIMTFPIFLYWAWLRYKPISIALTVSAVIMLASYAFLHSYSQIRHHGSQRAGVTKAMESMKLTAENMDAVTQANLMSTGQNSVECSLLAIHMFAGPEKARPQTPFGALYHIVVNPIPRELWEGKPVALGYELPRLAKDIYGLKGYGPVIWSINPVTYGYHDGGLIPIAIYAVLIGFFLRFFDEFLMRQATNPYVIGLFSASVGDVAGLARGSLDVMTWGLAASTITFFFLVAFGRILFGTGTVMARTDHVTAYPNLRSISKSLQSRSTQHR